MSTGVALIAAERERQIDVEGYTPDHDRGHAEELLVASTAYSLAAFRLQSADKHWDRLPAFWPWHEDYWKPVADFERLLVKSAALAAAAIDAMGTTSKETYR